MAVVPETTPDTGSGASRYRRFREHPYVVALLNIGAEMLPKGLYARASAGVIAEFTGVASPYETPTAPDLTVATEQLSPSLAADAVRCLLEERGWL